jgi:hypothetical protein
MKAQREKEDRAVERRRAWLIGLALLCCYGYFFYLGGNWNVESRSAQIWALAEHASLVIDEYPGLPEGGGDAAAYQGHYYSDKLIGPSLAAVPPYWLARHVLSAAGMPLRRAVYWALRVANVLANAVPSALLGALLYLFLADLGLDVRLRIWAAFAYGFGTLALPYSTALFGHQFAAVCVAGAFMLLWRQRRGWSAGRAVAAGALMGLAAISDFMGLVIALFLGLYAISIALRRGEQAPVGIAAAARRIAPVALVAALVLCIQLAANWASFGGPFELAQAYHATLAAHHEAGFLGIGKPKLEALYQLTVGPYRGLFFGSPLLLLALPGVFMLGRKMRVEAIIIGAAWLAVLIIHAGYTDWPAGTAYGPRYQIAAIPLLMIAAAEAARRSPFIFKALATVSIAFMVIVCAQNPFGIPVDVRNPLASALGHFATGNLQYWNLGMLIGLPSTASLLPLAAVEAALIYALGRVGAATKGSKQA